MRPLRATLVWIAAIILCLLIGAGVWAFNVATSGIKGQGDAVIQKNSAANWTAAQARFEDLYAGIKATDQKIDIHQAAADENPEDKTARQTLTGVESACLSLVADYNAEARKFLAQDFRAADLPTEIDSTDPATDCKGNK